MIFHKCSHERTIFIHIDHFRESQRVATMKLFIYDSFHSHTFRFIFINPESVANGNMMFVGFVDNRRIG